MTAKCTNCGCVLVDEDEQGWYYQTPVTDPEIPGLVFMDRVHECDGKPHHVEQQQDSSPRCDACDRPESHTFHDPDKRGKFSGYHAFQSTAS